METVEGDLINRCELFDETDIDTALARFQKLHLPMPRLENAASRAEDRFFAYFRVGPGFRNWSAMAELLADDSFFDDRRRVVNAGVWDGRDVVIANLRASPELGANITLTVIATRGERLALTRIRGSNRDLRQGEFNVELLGVAEVNAENRIVAHVAFDAHDIEAAFEELDARYLAGEAAAHAQTWSVISKAYAALNRRELAATTPDWVNIDHRRGIAAARGDLTPYIRAAWDVMAHVNEYIEAVHRLTNVGAVVTRVSNGTSQEGFDAEWREVDLMMVEGDLINRCEKFDEAELDAALARFEELRPETRRLENAASRADDRFFEHFGTRNWAAIAEILDDDSFIDDRRRVVNVGFWDGSDVVISNLRALAESAANITSTVIATRGERLALSRICAPNRDAQHEEFGVEMLGIAEINTDERILAHVLFDPDDIDAAFEELDARYRTGEAAAHAHTWSLVARAYTSLNRREMPPTTPDWVNLDHRRGRAFTPGDMIPYIRASWDVTPDICWRIEAVHRLNDLGAVVTHVSKGISQESFDAEWRVVTLLTFESDLISRCEMFDEADIDDAVARFDEIRRPARRLENAASRLDDRFETYFAARNWDAIAELMADDISVDDRRREVNAGLRRGRDVEIASLQAAADLGVREVTSSVIAIRGERLALSRNRFMGRDRRPEAFRSEVLCIVEIDADERIVARVSFDIDDIDAAFEELDARYLAGEAAANPHTWSLVTVGYAALNRHEIPPTKPEWVNIDHRRGIAFAPGDMEQYILATFEVAPDIKLHIEAVHRLTDRGAVVTHAAYGTSREGFDAEWREIVIVMFVGELLDRSEMFDETDLDAALARFDELSPSTPPLENAAIRVVDRYAAHFANRDWDAMAEILADDIVTDDRRRVVNAGIRHGRDVQIADMRAAAEVGSGHISLSVIATRGQRLALSCVRSWNKGLRPEEYGAEMLGIVEIDADERITALVAFDFDDLKSAFEELDSRYLAGEAAAHSRTWSVIARTYAAFNRRELPPTTSDWVNIDHRRVTSFAPGDTTAYLRATWDMAPDVKIHIEAVHRLSDIGGVVTHAAHGTSEEGFDAEWREITVLTVDGDLINRAEIFDEADIDAALARFDELNRPAPQLENAASQVYERIMAYFAARDWDAIKEILAEYISTEDRRRVVNAGLRQGRDAVIAEVSAIAAVGVTKLASEVIATRGGHLVLSRGWASVDQLPESFRSDLLDIVEIDADERVVARVVFDPEDIDAAFAELDARYLAGEAAAHSHTWSVVAQAFAALNRRELPATTPDWVTIDHQRGTAFPPGHLTPYIRAAWDDTPDICYRIEAVHRLSNLGAIITATASGSSQEGFHAEWRGIGIMTVEGDLINRFENFDESDIDAALARFEELHTPAPQLENAASQTYERYRRYFAVRNWAAMAELLTADTCVDDHRRVVNAEIRRGRDAEIANMRAVADIGAERITSTVIATRGGRLALCRSCIFYQDQQPGAFRMEFLSVVEINTDERIVARVAFDVDDIDAAFAELDARYLAGEADAYSRTWSVIAQAYTTLNRREIPATTPDLVTIDHRRAAAFAPGDLLPYLSAGWDLGQDTKNYIVAVHRLSNLGAVITHASYGTTQEGFGAEWRHMSLLTVAGDLFNRCELFDEADIDVALVRFDELNQKVPQLDNAATRARARVVDAMNSRDVDALLATATADGRYEDRRKMLRDEGPARPDFVRALFEATKGMRSGTEPVAIRGPHLALTRDTYRDIEDVDRPITAEHLTLTEVDAGGLVRISVLFDPDDIDAAMGELTARWIASGEVAHPEIIESVDRLNETVNRHDWDAIAAHFAGATYVNHRQLANAGNSTLADWLSSMRTIGSLIPDFWVELAEVLARSATGIVGRMALKGTSTDGVAIEIPYVLLILLDGDRVTRFEAFDEDQRDLAQARFEALSTSG